MKYALLVLVMLAGCSSGGGTPIRYYLIDPQQQTQPSERADLSLEIVDLQVPQYLERFQIASRANANELTFSDMNQWGENLRKNLTRTMGINLARLMGTVDVGTPVNRTANEPDYRIQIVIAQFERDAENHVTLLARFQIVPVAGGATRTESVQLTSDYATSDYPGTVSVMSDLFSDLGGSIARVIVDMEENS